MIGAYGIGCYLEEVCGDGNGNGIVGITDATYLLAFLYKNGPAPTLRVADVNGNGTLNILDVTYLIAHLFKSGPELNCPMK